MNYTDPSCREFISELSSSSPTPGGGGASALVGAVGTALSSMVASLTLGKKKYAQHEERMGELLLRCGELQEELMDGIKADAEGFSPLAAAYALPKDYPDREAVLQNASELACQAPLTIMEKCCEAIGIASEMAEKGSRLAVSDAGCSAAILASALKSAALNVYINTKSMTDRETAELLNRKCDAMLSEYVPMAEGVYERVSLALRG